MQRSTVSAAVRTSFRKCRLPPTPAHLRQSLHRAPGQLKAEGRYLVLGCSVPFYLNEARVSTARQRPPRFPFLLCPGLKQKRCPGVCGHNKLMECTSSVSYQWDDLQGKPFNFSVLISQVQRWMEALLTSQGCYELKTF